MDDNAQVPSVQSPSQGATQQPVATQTVSTNTVPAQEPKSQPSASDTTDVHRQMEPPAKQQITISGGHPEQGPIAMEVNEEDDDDEQPIAKQEAPIIQQSHPEVVLPPEVKNAGVEQG